MAIISVSDNFNSYSVGPLTVSGGNWLCNINQYGGRPGVVSGGDPNRVYSGLDSLGSPSTGYAVWATRSTGAGIIQTSQITLGTLPTIANRSGVIVAAPNDYTTQSAAPYTYNPLPSPPTIVNWSNQKPFYMLRARTSEFRIEKKIENSSAVTVLGTPYAATPVAGDIIKLEYNPSSGELKGYINGTLRITTTDPSPINANDATGIGFVVDTNGYADTWLGSWDTGGSGTISKTSVGDSTQITGTDASTAPVVSAPSQTVSDQFNRADGWIGNSVNWVTATTTNPVISSNQLTSTGSGTAVHTASFDGIQSVQAKLTANGSTNTTRGAVMAGVENKTTTNTSLNWYTTGPFYRFTVRSATYVLQVKGPVDATFTDVDTYTPAGGVQIGDIMKMTYDPATGRVKCFVNDLNNPVIDITNRAALPATHTRVGIWMQPGNSFDDFSATWLTDQTPADTYRFYQLSYPGGVETLTPLTAKQWNGSTEVSLNMNATTIYQETTSTLDQVQPIHSDVLLEKFGVNTAFKRDATLYNGSNLTVTQNLCIDLGVRFLRERVFGADVGNMSHTTALHNAGIKFSMNVCATGGDIDQIRTGQTLSDKTLIFNWIEANASMVNNIQGWNEPNKPANSSWATDTRNHQKKIWDEFVARDLHLYQHSGGYGEKMYVLGPALMDDPDAAQPISNPAGGIYYSQGEGAYFTLGATDIENYMHRGNWHRYPLQSLYPTESGVPTYPENNYEREAWAATCYGNKPLEMTEYGFLNVQNSSAGSTMNWNGAAVYHVRMMIDGVLRGSSRLYQYDLLDAPGTTAPWGLVDAADPDPTKWVKKTSYNTIKDLLTLFNDPTNTAFTPPKVGLELTYNEGTLGPENGGLRWGLFAKQNNTKYLVMWRLVRIWDRQNGGPLTPGTISVQVKTDNSDQSVTVGGFPILVTIDSTNTITGVTNLSPSW